MSTAEESLENGGKAGLTVFFRELTSAWPSLPFMALGLWTAWSSLTYSGSLWLSDNESDGTWLSNLFIISTLAFAVAFLLASLKPNKGERWVSNERFVIAGGLLCGAGCVAIILSGPYYLGAVSWAPIIVQRLHFMAGAALSGIGSAAIGMRCGVLYGSLPPRRALVYAALSQLVCAFIYFLTLACPRWAPVEHGPSLASIVVFCLLPVAAAAVSCLQGVEPSSRRSTVRDLPAPAVKFILFAFFLSFVVSLTRAMVVTTHALATTLEGNNLIMLLRVVMGLVFVVYGMHANAHGIGLGKICSLIAVFSAIVMAAVAAFGGLTSSLSVVVYFASSVFEFLMWVLLAFIVAQKRLSSVVVFGFGRGMFMLGCGLGWLIGTFVMPLVPSSLDTGIFLTMAGVILVAALGLFSERDYERLFSEVGEDELTLADLFDIDAREAQAEAESLLEGGSESNAGSGQEAPAAARNEKHGRFTRAIEKMTAEYGLSARESDVLRCLAMGYGSERMAEKLGIKVNTARAHTHNVYVKLEVHSREDLMLLVDDEVAAMQ